MANEFNFPGADVSVPGFGASAPGAGLDIIESAGQQAADAALIPSGGFPGAGVQSPSGSQGTFLDRFIEMEMEWPQFASELAELADAPDAEQDPSNAPGLTPEMMEKMGLGQQKAPQAATAQAPPLRAGPQAQFVAPGQGAGGQRAIPPAQGLAALLARPR